MECWCFPTLQAALESTPAPPPRLPMHPFAEMFRVSKRWIMHCEKYEKTEKQIDENHKFRNMGEKWLDYKVKLVSDVDLHEDYGLDQTRFTLLKKL